MTFKKRSSFKIFKSVLFALILREMRSRFGARRFGIFWMFFEPVAQIALVMTFFYFRGTAVVGSIGFPLFLLTGMVPFFMMRSIIFKGMEAVNANKALFSYKQIKPFDTVLARTIVEVVLWSCVYVILLCVLGFWFDYSIIINEPMRWLTVLLIGIVLSFSLALFFCVLIEIIPDSKTFVRLLSFPVYILTGVLFPIWILPQEVLNWLLWNPFLHIIDELRLATFPHYPDHHNVNIMYPFQVAVVFLLLALAIYRIRRLKLISI